MVIMCFLKSKFHFWLLFALCLIKCSLEFDPDDNHLINCGSPTNASVGNRVFLGDSSVNSSIVLSTPHTIWANTSSNSIPFSYSSDLYKTAQIFTGSSNYTFSVSKHGRHWVRLHFFPFVYQNYNLSHAHFSVSALNFTLLRNFQSQEDIPVIKEFCLNITSDKFALIITPSSKSFAFLNALEVVSVPDELIPDSVKTIDPPGSSENLVHQALETVFRVNMGNVTVDPRNDTLSRQWIPDGSFLRSHNLVQFLSQPRTVNYTEGGTTKEIAPPSVYGTASKLNSELDPTLNVNLTWYFDVDPGFKYLVRFHFCDIISKSSGQLMFNVYINSWYAYKHLDLSRVTSNKLASPYYLDVLMRESHSNMLSVSVGTSSDASVYPNALLNGLEIIKLSNSRGLLDVDPESLKSRSKVKAGLIAGIAVGVVFVILILASAFFLVVRRRKRTQCDVYGNKVDGTPESGYQFSLAAIRKATDNFNESLVIGVGGFGKVYKGVFEDNREVAIKRGNSDSQQGLNEFRTEIEMLSHFRHRHLVALIGYCDEQNEMILIYEYMEKGTLKSHLYGSDNPSLSWKQRLEICIGSARGLHYLHTGSAKAVIHRDVKSANILLDENLMAKVADFGLSKAGPDIDKTHVTTAVKGSFGYLDPEYLIRQQLTEKSDVYSFGVVLFEVLCGRPVIDPSLPREMVNLVEWATKLQKKGEVEKIIDPNLADQIKVESLNKFLETAEKCLAECGLDRPTMGEVLWNLEYALQLQEDEAPSIESDDVSLQIDDARPLQTLPSTRQYSLGSAGDIVDISMNTVFSQMRNGNLK
ncbi:probable receptor-like protein kinase At5g59700 [Beta vulgaris subsp. vulgaris]|uniref:probable receptor-like protein kinase At5g59700 n=1 Tax=Beta vulgaris subsp. vulgaris TaxID=3555 RepID=UPI002036BDFA|nr:probable receptor-like protein kinase At5g59700 [Beta vulgaris subsp. vulgaris]